MKLSIIIPVYNAEKYISRCLESVLEAGMSDYEIICVDDGSTDQSLVLLQEYEKNYNNIKVLTQKNSFAGIARNYGMQYAKGEYIHFLDVDDVVVSGAYQKVLNIAERLGADYLKVGAEAIDIQIGEKIERSEYLLSCIEDNKVEQLLSRNIGVIELMKTSSAPWTAIVRKSYIENQKLMFNNLRCVNDRSFFVDAISHTDKLAICKEVLVIHQVNNKESLVGIRHKYYECNIQSCELVEQIVQDIPEELRRYIIGAEINDAVFWYSLLDDNEKDRYRGTLKKYLEKIQLDSLYLTHLFHPFMDIAYELVGTTLIDVIGFDYRIKEIQQLCNIFENATDIIIYGAGQVATRLIKYLSDTQRDMSKIHCIMVSNTYNNPKHIQGISVKAREEVEGLLHATVVLATFENVQISILSELTSKGYQKVFVISNSLFEKFII